MRHSTSLRGVLITYQGRAAALTDGQRVWLMPEIEVGDSATRRFVAAKAACVLHASKDPLGPPLGSDEAEFVARWLLMPDTAFAARARLPDARLAELFEVPIAEVDRKRVDLALVAVS